MLFSSHKPKFKLDFEYRYTQAVIIRYFSFILVSVNLCRFFCAPENEIWHEQKLYSDLSAIPILDC